MLNNQLVAEGKIPVFSANVQEPFGFIDDLFIDDFSAPSVFWGIDGDWMTRYWPRNMPFYPTDHCGVLRCKTSEVNPRYLAHILEREGAKMGFSRSYRASIDRISEIAFMIPDREIQDKTISQIEEIEHKICEAKNYLSELNEKIADILNRYLGS